MSYRVSALFLLTVCLLVTGCLGSQGLEGNGDGEVVENPSANLTDGLGDDELRVRADGEALTIAYSIKDRDFIGGTKAAIEVIEANDSTRHYCPGNSSGVLRVPLSHLAQDRGSTVALWEDDRLLPTTPCRDIGGFGTQGSIKTEVWRPEPDARDGR
jgi:hypothetical protein